MIRYPLGEQSFKVIREDGYVYVDKTQYIPLLLENKYYFLSRPRRFGKSLFLSTLENFFLGRRELFEGLAVDSYDWDWSEYPVIRIDLNGPDYLKPQSLIHRIEATLQYYEDKYGIESVLLSISERFRNLLTRLCVKTGEKVVVLVDEYEKPLLDAFQATKILESHKGTLREFYSVLKSESDSLKFVFLTGVTRFGHLNIFSGLNNITDISLRPEYSGICGITNEELTEYFTPGIQKLADENNWDFNEALSRLKDYYDGYHFSRALIDIYNPYSLFNCLSESKINAKWFQSGSSTYLLNILRNSHFELSDIEDQTTGEDVLLGIDPSMENVVSLLYQSGYLTIKAYNPEWDLYTLGIPNTEVRKALFTTIIPYYLNSNYRVDNAKPFEFIRYLSEGEAEKAMAWLKSFFSSIPYDVKLDYEKDFQAVIYSFFALIGLLSKSHLEKATSNGRIDMVLTLRHYIYIFEFKLDTSATRAMEQINSRDYALPWRADGRKVFKIGVAFSPETRGIADFLIETE